MLRQGRRSEHVYELDDNNPGRRRIYRDYALLQEKRFGGHALGCARKYVSASG